MAGEGRVRIWATNKLGLPILVAFPLSLEPWKMLI